MRSAKRVRPLVDHEFLFRLIFERRAFRRLRIDNGADVRHVVIVVFSRRIIDISGEDNRGFVLRIFRVVGDGLLTLGIQYRQFVRFRVAGIPDVKIGLTGAFDPETPS